MKLSNTLDLLLVGTLLANPLPSVAFGQKVSNPSGRQTPAQACTPYSPTFIPCDKDWKTIRNAKLVGGAARVYTFPSYTEIFHLDCYTGAIKIIIAYLCGERGGSGKLRIRTYLDDPSTIRAISLDHQRTYPISVDGTNISKKTYEIDINEQERIVSYASTEERLVPSFSLGDKAEEVAVKGLQAILKSAGEKVNLSDIEAAKRLIGDAVNYQRDVDRQRVIQKGNWITGGNHVFLNEIEWYRLGLIEKLFGVRFPDFNLHTMADDRKLCRKVVLLETLIILGEESIKGLILDIGVVGYRQTWLMGVRDSYRTILSIPLDVSSTIDSLKLR